MNISIAQKKLFLKRWWLPAAILLAAISVLFLGRGWMPDVKKMLLSAHASAADDGQQLADADEEHAHEHGENADEDHSTHASEAETETSAGLADEHDHAAKPHYDHPHDEASSIKLSRQAKANIGLRIERVELKPFERTITMPGMVVERPGWSTLEITAPMTGVVTRIFPIQGEAVKPGQPLFEIRLTHEDLLQLQTEFLRTVEELDVIAARGRPLGKSRRRRGHRRQNALGTQVRTAKTAGRLALAAPGPVVARLDRRGRWTTSSPSAHCCKT